ncbi:MAG: MFS family permease [Candidatus Azotimanducaceae bacterium]|jgi:MFS family permease
MVLEEEVIKGQYFWYMFGLASFVISMGLQMVLFPWLIVVELNESAQSLGFAQMSTQLPGLSLILFGGLLADRVDPRKILIAVSCLVAISPMMLVYFIAEDKLSYEILIVYALLVGAGTAFIQPARDSLLNVVANGDLQKTVTVSMGLGFAGQGLGFFIASFAEVSGPIMLLALQSSFFLLSALAGMMLLPASLKSPLVSSPALSEIKAGIKIVFGSEHLRPTFILLTFMSMFFGGTFMVVNPIIIRDIYEGGAREISMSFGVFMLGTVIISVLLVATGGIKNQGRALLLAITGGVLFLGSTSQHLSFSGYLTALFCWGLCGGIAMSMGRSIMQIHAPELYRARVIAFFSIANLGGMPIGAMIMGYSIGQIGPLNSIYVSVSGIAIAAIVVNFTSNLASNNISKPSTLN